MLHLSNNLKEKKRNINIDLAILLSHDNRCGQAQRDEEVLQSWRNRSSHCKVLQTKKGEERRSGDYRECNGRFFPGQRVSTNLPAFIDSKILLPKESMKDFLDYFGARKYEMNKGYSVE